MSGWYWLLWAVLTIVNADLFLATLRRLTSPTETEAGR